VTQRTLSDGAGPYSPLVTRPNTVDDAEPRVVIGGPDGRLSLDRPSPLGLSVRATLDIPGRMYATRQVEMVDRDDLPRFFRQMAEAWRGVGRVDGLGIDGR
jgi:hypothetical protein